MHLLGAQGVGAIAGSRQVLREVTLGIEDGDRIGILGPNGAGKSTLLRLLSGQQEPDFGEVTRTGGVSIAAVSQIDTLNPQARVIDVLHGELAEYEWAADPFIRDIHSGMLAGISLDECVKNLSGGQRRRVAIARALAAKADILFLDEPTNHLDIEAVAWLAKHIQDRFGIQTVRAQGAQQAAQGFGSGVTTVAAQRKADRRGSGVGKAVTVARKGAGALVVVTHDRWFLDAVCSRIWEVVPGIDPGGDRPQIPGGVESYEGSYAAYVLARAERERQAGVAAQKRSNLLKKELAWLRRGAPARTSKPKFHIAAAEALIADVPPPRDCVKLAATASARLGKDVIDLENVTLTFPGADILKDAVWRLAPGERVGLIGVNGAGKTSVLRLLNGTLEPSSGRVRRGKTVQCATLSQSMHELDAICDLRVVEAVAQVRQSITIDGKETTASQLVERLGFSRGRAWTRVGDLSGGERRRLQLLRLICTEPNVLILDEPTNDLDTDTLAVVEDLLDSFPGTLIVVSHDRYLLERVTDHQVALLGDGKISAIPGGVEQYLQLRAQQLTEVADTATEAKSAGSGSGAESFKLRKQVRAAERVVQKLTAQAVELDAKLAAAASDLSPLGIENLAKLSAERQRLSEQIDEAEAAWLELLELLDE